MLGKLLLLSPSERRVLLRAALLLGAVRLGLWLLPFSTQRCWLARLSRNPACRSERDSSVPTRLARAVAQAARLVPRATCLAQALTLQTLLARAGYPSQLHIGVGKTADGALQAHAWVKSQGQVLIGGSGMGGYTTRLNL